MADIYQYAACNLAAIARDATQCGLAIKHPTRQANVQVSVDMNIKEVRLNGVYDLVDSNTWQMRVENAPLNKRGWVLQEQFLSPRILCFTNNQIFWQCNMLRACETWPLGFGQTAGSEPRLRFYHSFDQSGIRRRLSRTVLKRMWSDLVYTYTRSNLTYPSDKLPALAGLIARFEMELDDTCVSGLWKESLLRDLLWYRTGKDERSHLRHNERAPSWSWACSDAHVRYLRSIENMLPAFISECVGLDTIDERTGCLKGRALRLKAPLIKAICPLIPYKHSRQWVHLQHRSEHFRLVYDKLEGDTEGILLTAEQTLLVPRRFAKPHDEPFGWVYLLFIGKSPYTGLLLKRLPQPGHYIRIGYFNRFNTVLRGGSLDFMEDTCEIKEEDYDESHGQGIYTVTLQ
jgi:hypothetical protein